MYAVLGEDDSDAQMIRVLIRRLLNDDGIRIQPKGFEGCGALLRKGAKQLQLFSRLGYRRFVVCYDADEDNPEERRRTVMDQVVNPSGVGSACCVVIPVQEIEAWILADVEAVSHVFSSWRPRPFKQPPETVRRPKEALERLSKWSRKKPIYAHATHNPIVAAHLDLAVLDRRCPSFRRLREFIVG